MLDFAKSPSANRRSSSKSFFKSIKLLLKKIQLFFKIVLIVLLIAAGAAITSGLIAPYFVDYDVDRNLIVYQLNDEREFDRIWLMSLKADTNEIRVYRFPNDHPVKFLSPESQKIEEQILAELLSTHLPQETSLAFFSWIAGRIIEQTIELPPQAVVQSDNELEKYLTMQKDDWLDLHNLASNQELLKLKLWAKKAGWSFADQLGQLPETKVLPNHCSVALINLTPISGYASAVAEILETSGVRVIRIDSSRDYDTEQSAVFFDTNEPSCINLSDILVKNFFSDQTLINPDQDLSQQLLNRYRADLVILLKDDQLLKDG